MKITFIIDHMSIGGAQRVCYNLLTWLQSNTDADVSLLIHRKLKIGDIKYDLTSIPHYYLEKGAFRKILSIHRLLKDLDPDLFVSFGAPNSMYDVLGKLGLRAKHIVCERNDPSHFKGRTITRILSRLLMRKADGFVFQTKDAQAFYGGNIAKHSVVIQNPLFILKDAPQTTFEIERRKEIVTAGRLNKQKNHALLIRSFATLIKKYPDYRLIIYGEGPERKNDEELIESLCLQEKVILPGAINDVPSAIYNSSIFVLSSDFEGMPNALMEAMAMGVPCISTDCPCGGPRDLITNGENGLLVPVGDIDSLVSALNLLINNREFADKLGKNGLDIRNKLSINNIGNMWYNYFQLLINE